jgi:hypothetical protein
MVDVEHTEFLVRNDNSDVYSGGVGSVKMVINSMQPPLHPASTTAMAQRMVSSPMNIKSILVTGAISGLANSNITSGDLVIYTLADRDADYSGSIPTQMRSLSQQAAILQREVGHDGRWLSSNFPPAVLGFSNGLALTEALSRGVAKYPCLHYENLSQGSQNSLREETTAAKSVPDFNVFAKGFCGGTSSRILTDSFPVFGDLAVDGVIILTTGRHAGSSDSMEEYDAALAASYAKELLQGMSDGLTNRIEDLRGTEFVVPPNLDIKVPLFEPLQLPRHGEAILLVIPTANESKARLLREVCERQKPKDVVMYSIEVPSDSGVGEQPYNDAGVLGAHTRISNALRRLNAPEYQHTLVSKNVGTVIVASVENFIQLDNVSRPTDYGVVVIHNGSTGKTAASLSWGVTIPPAYVKRARRFGFEGNPNYGKVTVGQILAAHVPGLDKADFHSVLAGRSRYDLLTDSINLLTVPW